jgi:hypothetical protein
VNEVSDTPDDPRQVLRGHLDELGAALSIWATRDDSKAQPAVTRAGHQVVDSIDAMLSELHRLRSQLVSEVRQHSDAAAARVDELLEREPG